MNGAIDVLRQKQISDILRAVEIGISSGNTLIEIGRKADQILGFRDAAGNVIDNAVSKSGVSYQAIRIIRTELLRAYAQGAQEEFNQAQNAGIKTRLMLVSVLDDRTRKQSAKMDGKYSNSEGKFQYPDGNWYYPHQTGHPEWDINDRETTIQIIDGYTADARSAGEGVINYQNFEEWALDNGIDESVYGQIYF